MKIIWVFTKCKGREADVGCKEAPAGRQHVHCPGALTRLYFSRALKVRPFCCFYFRAVLFSNSQWTKCSLSCVTENLAVYLGHFLKANFVLSVRSPERLTVWLTGAQSSLGLRVGEWAGPLSAGMGAGTKGPLWQCCSEARELCIQRS